MGVLERAAQRQANGETFALATVVRTISVTAAKAGAKALISSDGVIEEGWIGGGCARAAVLKAARQSMREGSSRLVLIAPKELLADLGVSPGEDREGVFYMKNSCPSQGTMDIFVEPVLPRPRLLILGASPVAVELAKLAPQLGFGVTVAAAATELDRFDESCEQVRGTCAGRALGPARLCRRLHPRSRRSRRSKDRRGHGRSLSRFRRLAAQGRDATSRIGRGRSFRGRVGGDQGSGGLDILAITSEEIALSILAEMVASRRRIQAAGGGD